MTVMQAKSKRGDDAPQEGQAAPVPVSGPHRRSRSHLEVRAVTERDRANDEGSAERVGRPLARRLDAIARTDPRVMTLLREARAKEHARTVGQDAASGIRLRR